MIGSGRTFSSPLPPALRLLLPLVIFSAFLTQMKLIPGMANNFGPFELLGGAVIVLFLIRSAGSRLAFDPIVRVVGAMLLLAAFSMTWIGAGQRVFGIVQTLILAFLFLFLLAFHNLCIQYRFSPHYLMRWIVTALLVVGPWIVMQTGRTEDITASGPFRNRAHMAIYMLTAFWMSLVLALWPGISKRIRIAAYLGIAFTLYSVAISGRRSVYLSLFVGLAALGLSVVGTSRGRRFKMAAAASGVVLFLAGLYFYGADISPRLDFFQQRVAMVDDRLEAAAGVEGAAESDFFTLQKEGIRMALQANPVVGIGWGGFPGSVYSPTGHEVHSTPLRFLAELGIVGFLLYVLLLALLGHRLAVLYLRLRGGAFGPSYLALLVGFASMTISWVYNRHITERTFWLLLGLVLAMDVYARYLLGRRATAPARAPRREPTKRPAVAARTRRSGGLSPLSTP